ncbi:hypothetical protein [Hyphomonas johnsonii]|nr:hypothetical protein [Hyphomonas johnsonii]
MTLLGVHAPAMRQAVAPMLAGDPVGAGCLRVPTGRTPVIA